LGEEQRPRTGLDRTERSGQSAILDEGSEDYRVALRLDRRDAVLPFVARRPAPLAEITVEFERLERQRLDLAQPVALFHRREDVGPISESPPHVRLRTVLRERGWAVTFSGNQTAGCVVVATGTSKSDRMER